jgi:hypothetical protein
MPQEETVLDAVNAALGDTITEPSENTHAEEVEDSPGSDTGDGSGTEGVEGGTDVEESDTESDAETEETEADDKERGPDGKFKKKEEKPEGEVEKPAKVEPPKKDPINDPIPENLKKDTSERIRSLIDTTKTVTAERDRIQTDFDYLIKGVESTGATPEQYGETLSWLSLFNSKDPVQQEKALELVENVAERLSTLLGKERVVGDPLSAHADLKDAVAKGQITAQYAKEIARTRNGQQFRTELTTNATQAQQQQQEFEQAKHTARTDLSALEQTLMASDPQYEQKKAILVPVLKPIFASMNPKEWKAKFQEAYKGLNITAPKPTVKTPVQQPLRAGKQPAGGQTKEPGSMLEAISGALGSMGK